MKLSRISVLLLALVLVFTTGCFSIFGAKEYTISGTVVDTEGNPIEGVKINITGKTKAVVDEFDEEGAWTAVVKGNVTVIPVHELYSFAPAEIEVKAARDNLDFVGTYLGPYNIAGTVLDEFGNTISGTKVVITGQVEKEVDVNAEDGTWSAEVRGKVNVTAVDEDIAFSFNTLNVSSEASNLELVGKYVLVTHYKLDETEGNTIADASKNGNDASFVGTLKSTTSPVGNAVTFDGVTNYIHMPDGLLSTLDEVTIATWVKTDEDRYWSRVFSFGHTEGNTPDGVLFLTVQGSNFETDEHLGELKLDYAVFDLEHSIFIMGPKLEFGQWYHIAVTINENNAQLFVDGALVGETANTAKPSDLGFTAENYIGKCNSRWPDPLLKGAFDDFRIYSEVLSTDKIAQLAAVKAE